mmetsp:Transcript_980/g.3813  ORF Transcript_980/g.3813 Transcript_980/m.3813 type:complete len:203 (+) Transcript_980:308-916(+)
MVRCTPSNPSRSLSLRVQRRSGRLRATPMPEHGASTSTLSNAMGRPSSCSAPCSSSAAAATHVTQLEAPCSFAACCIASTLCALLSAATTRPSPCMSAAASSALPPGAAQASSTRSPGRGASAAWTTSPAASSCTAHCPLASKPAREIACRPVDTRAKPGVSAELFTAGVASVPPETSPPRWAARRIAASASVPVAEAPSSS